MQCPELVHLQIQSRKDCQKFSIAFKGDGNVLNLGCDDVYRALWVC